MFFPCCLHSIQHFLIRSVNFAIYSSILSSEVYIAEQKQCFLLLQMHCSPPCISHLWCLNNAFCWSILCCTSGFPGSSAGKESACNAGDTNSIPGSGRFPGEGMGYPLQYSWVYLVALMVKNPPAMRETWVRSLGWEDPWRWAWQPTPVFLPGEFHG